MKDKLGGQIMEEFVGLRVKTYSYLKDSNNEDKKSKGKNMCRKKLNFKITKTAQKPLQLKIK